MTTIGLIFRILNTLIMIGIPVAGAFLLTRRGKGGFRPIWIGAVAFILSQVGHIPFNRFLMLPGLASLGVDVSAQGGISLWVLGAAAGLSAGVFEEAARYLALKFWLKKEAHTLLPLKYGMGHGGIEALLVGLLTLTALVQVFILQGDSALVALTPDQAALARTQLEAYWAVPWFHSLLGAWERISAVMFHLGASLLVYKTVRTKKAIYLICAVFGHMLLNAFAVISIRQMDLILMEGLIFIFSAGWLYWAWTIREVDLEEIRDLSLPGQVQYSTPQVTPEQLNESRYDE